MLGSDNIKTYSLLFVEDELSNQYAQSPDTARVLTNWIPSRSRNLTRKAFAPPFCSTQPTIGGASAWYSFVRAYLFYEADGTLDRQIIVGVSNNTATVLYKYVAGSLIALPTGATTPPHNPATGWVGDPLLLYTDGRLYISDGFEPEAGRAWTVYDGTDAWKMGLDIPGAPTANSNSSPGSIDISLFREYVVTEWDDNLKRESPPGARYRFTPGTPGTYDVTINLPAQVNVSTGWTTGAATHYRIYGSKVDGSTQLYRLDQVDIGDSVFVDTIPFWGDTAATSMDPFEPPYLNHRPKPSLVGTKLSNRFAMRDETQKSRFWITGRAEVVAQDPASNANPYETSPGRRNDDISDVRNLGADAHFYELPDESGEIRGMLWREDGLMVGTERNVSFFWGDKPENIIPANSVTYNFGLFHKRAWLLTTHGLVIFTSDRKLLLDPAASKTSGDRTAAVIDIGWGKQPELDKTDIRYSNRFQMVHYQFGSNRDWLVVAYTTQNVIDGGTAHLIIYDFELGGWISFDDVAATCVGIVQEDEGFDFLVAGNSVSDRQLKVAADYNGSASSPYAAAATRVGLPATGTVTIPANSYRTSLLDLGESSKWKIWNFLSYYKSAAFTVTVSAWYDPADVDNLGSADETVTFSQLSSNEYLGWLGNMGRQAKRAVFQFDVAAGGVAGSLQGIEIGLSPKSNVGR